MVEFKRKSLELLYDAKIVALYKDVLETPDGGEVVYDLIKHKSGGGAGILLVDEDIYHVSNMISSVGTFDEKTDVYIGRNLKKGKRHLDPTEFIEIVRVPMEEAREMIYSGKIVDSKTIVAILAYYDKKSRGIFK